MSEISSDQLVVRIIDRDEDTLKMIQILNLVISNISSVRGKKLDKFRVIIKPGSIYSEEVFLKYNFSKNGDNFEWNST